MTTGTKALSTYGTPFLVKPINTLGALGAYNLRQETYADALAISGEEMHARYHDRDTTCLKCPVACGKQYEIRDGELRGSRPRCPSTKPSSPSAPCWGTPTRARSRAPTTSATCWGSTPSSMGVTLAFLAEALERGWVSAAEVGVPFGWGNWEGMLRLIEQTAAREGFGDRLAEGSWRLAESLHPEATRSVYAVKRLELPAHSARALKGLSIGYATATRGGSHHDTRPTPQYAPDLRQALAGRQARVRGAQPALHGGGRFAGHLPLHLRAWLRPLRGRAVRADGPGHHRLGRHRGGAGAHRRAGDQSGARVQRARRAFAAPPTFCPGG